MDKRLYEKYKINIDEKLKRDMIDVCSKVYGEKFRSKFEQNVERIVVHASFTVEKLEKFLKNSQDKSEDHSLEEQAIEEYKQEKSKVEEQIENKKIELQLKLIERIKEDLTPEEMEQLDQELQLIDLKGEFNSLDLKMQSFFNGVEVPLLLRITEEYGLDWNSSKAKDRKPYVQEYIKNITDIEKSGRTYLNLKYSTYDILEEELNRY